VAEVVAQAVLTLFLLLSKHYALAALHVAFDLYLGHLLMEKRLSVDATDAFKQLPAQKRQRTIQLAFHVLSFMIVVYKWVAARRGSGGCGGAGRVLGRPLLGERPPCAGGWCALRAGCLARHLCRTGAR
jgi:hypothetical protein